MAKKRSFFERLAGNLRFDDEDDFDDVQEQAPRYESRRAPVVSERERREVPIHLEEKRKEEKEIPLHIEDEEIGELPVDVYETGSEIVIQTLIAGVLPEHLSINITRDTVTISGKREENRSIDEDGYHIRELYWGAFGRTVHLPVEVEIDAAEAIERHGMLMIKLPKLDKARKTTLKIKSI
ncbi:MAG TPA: Hsp20/alpha crystallin family protein [Candidatus Paceibacterota bacterium]|nr:Hsp20/alpha crystallin family protein [Candidatus Paceibacterota bacterium]